jgi:hypothetical protein
MIAPVAEPKGFLTPNDTGRDLTDLGSRLSGKRRPCRELERLTGIEPAYQAWEASALPLSYSRIGTSQNQAGVPNNETHNTSV